MESKAIRKQLQNHLREATYSLPKPFNKKPPSNLKESAVQKEIYDFLKKTFPVADVWRIEGGAKLAHAGGSMAMLPSTGKGRPDIQMIHDGKIYGLEIKIPGGRVKACQITVLERMQANGAIVAIVTSLKGAIEVMYGLPGTPLLTRDGPTKLEVY